MLLPLQMPPCWSTPPPPHSHGWPCELLLRYAMHSCCVGGSKHTHEQLTNTDAHWAHYALIRAVAMQCTVHLFQCATLMELGKEGYVRRSWHAAHGCCANKSHRKPAEGEQRTPVLASYRSTLVLLTALPQRGQPGLLAPPAWRVCRSPAGQ